MKRIFSQLTSAFFIIIFLVNGAAPILPWLSLPSSKQNIAELLTKTESENTSKEKEGKSAEEDLFHHRIDLQLAVLKNIDSRKHSSLYLSRWQNIFLPIATPPPEQT